VSKIISINLAAKKNEILSEDFIHKIFEFSGGYFNETQLKTLFSLIESEAVRHYYSRTSESNLLRVISAAYDKVSFLDDCLKFPHYIELLVSITANSNYLTDILVRNPEYFYSIANPSYIEKTYSEKDYDALTDSAVNSFSTFTSKVNALRRLKRKEILRIGSKDIFLKRDISEITGELSLLAKAVASRLFAVCYDQVLNKYQLDLSHKRYCLSALGKLGGNELNYSSDIDLIIFYDENDVLPGQKEYHEILTETALLFIESASSMTENGYIYRVDFRLRPDGRNSPLCRRLSDYLIYYESRGEDWERQMLIKASFIAGNHELFNKFVHLLTPFIYPASFKTSPAEQIRRLKENIERNLTNDENIKLIPGGIRDIEFSVQALQLLNGGRIQSLRTGSTLKAISELGKNHLLSTHETAVLRNAYIFYRRIEHYLQLMNDTQTHIIPAEGDLLNKLSFYLGYKNSQEFLKTVAKYRSGVLRIFKTIMGKNKRDDIKDLIYGIRFSNQQSAEKDLLYLREGKGILGSREFDKHSMEAFDKISSSLYKYLLNSDDPDIVLKNFVRVVRQAGFPSIWYDEFRDRKFFNAFLKICEFSQSAIDSFAEDKYLREILLSKRAFVKISSSADMPYKEFIFLLYVQFTLSLIKRDKVSSLLSEFFHSKINKFSESLDRNTFLKDHYFIGAMGSFGSGEMTFASDIDLIFITDNLETNPSEQNIFIDFLTELREEFRPVSVDCRLRPEGKSSMLVWDIDTYVNYISARARIWELQALTKLRFIKGNKKLFNRIIRAALKRLKTENKENIRSGLLEMRRKMLPVSAGSPDMINLKKSAGGLIDIEFILQYLILCNPQLFQKFRSKNIKTILNGIMRHSPEYSQLLEPLIINHGFLKSLLLNHQNIFHQSGYVILKDKSKFLKISSVMQLDSPIELEKELMNIMKNNTSIFRKIIG
jgi:[glutamine synthetase] adenylyltransferase / [glutamine synthetase]-adenylyl-L-tyrosine phosphorylase